MSKDFAALMWMRLINGLMFTVLIEVVWAVWYMMILGYSDYNPEFLPKQTFLHCEKSYLSEIGDVYVCRDSILRLPKDVPALELSNDAASFDY